MIRRIFFEFIFLFMSVWLIERGLLSRFASVVFFISELPLIAAPQYYVVENSGTLSSVTLFLPAFISQALGVFFIVMAYIAVASTLKFMGRDPLGRKPIPRA